MKSMSNTSISFGLVNIPVKLYKATESHGVEFHQHHGGSCGGAIGYTRVCKTCAKPVEYADIVKGHETGDGGVVIVTGDELAAVEHDTIGGIEVLQFCHADEIPPLILDTAHYLEPNLGKAKGGKGGNLPGYSLLRQVLEESQRVGIVRYVIRDAAHMAVLRVDGNVLVLQNIVWAEDVRSPEFASLAKRIDLDPKMVKAAHSLVESMMGSFEHAAFTDGYAEAVRELVAAKASGTVAHPAASDDAGTEDVADLLAALESSVKAREGKAAAKQRHPAGQRKNVA